jgi:Uma2 family endonuclease
MPTALSDVPLSSAAEGPRRKRWTRAECAAIEAAGVLDVSHLELIEGELIDKMGKKRPHVTSVTLMQDWLKSVFGNRFVNAEAPIDVAPEDSPTNEPEPDVTVLNRDYTTFQSANPRPRDLCLLVEVADTTLRFDLTTKAALYARAGIIEYWVLDVSGRRLIVHRNPQLGKYTTVVAYSESESIAPLAAPDALFKIADAFPG